MKPTKEILNLLRKRREAGEKLTKYDSLIHSWCEKHCVSVYDIETENGCMITAEPSTYERLFIERIEEL